MMTVAIKESANQTVSSLICLSRNKGSAILRKRQPEIYLLSATRELFYFSKQVLYLREFIPAIRAALVWNGRDPDARTLVAGLVCLV
jgi:hypothetical protein